MFKGLAQKIKKISLIFILLFAFLFIFIRTPFLYASQDIPLINSIQSEIKSDEILIEYKDNTKKEEMFSIEQKHNTKLIDEIEKINVRRVKITGKSNVYEAIEKFKSNREVKNAEPVYLRHLEEVPNDSHFSAQWSLSKIQAPLGWDIEKGLSNNVTVAVIDTGIDLDHPDLVNKLWINSDEISNDGIDNDNNGFIDDYNGYNIASKNSDINDYLGHGTEVTGVIAADTNNQKGIAGLSWGAKIMMVKVASEDGLITNSDVVAAIIYAGDNGAKVINISLGGNYFSSIENEAIEYASNRGVTVVAAGGNDKSERLSYPASYDNVISVSATDENDELTYFSNFNKKIDVSAPGYNIFTTALNGSYSYVDGTSFAAPHTTGLASLILSQNPSLTPLEVEQKIEQSADDLGYPGRDDYFGYGRINVYRALGGNPAQPAQPSRDSFEDNDLFENAKTISIDSAVQPNIYPSGDKDWFKFHLGNPAKVSIKAIPPGPIDIVVSLYDSSGKLLMQEDPNHEGISETLIKNLAESGDYYILVNGFYGNASINNYSLSVSLSSFSPTDIIVPGVSIDSPLNNSYLSNYINFFINFINFINFKVTADNDVEKVVFYYSSDEGKTWKWFDEDKNGADGWTGHLYGWGMDGSYKIQALAYDFSQNVGRSTINVVIDDISPSKPTGLSALPVSKNQINVSWLAQAIVCCQEHLTIKFQLLL
ncbi:MAG: peptidase S8 [Actinobacteria bacterium]|nr:peptidase S8 [Actinomycetota bacterium]